MKADEELLRKKPTLSATPSIRECIRYVRRLTRWIGPGFHPDTPFDDYVRMDSGERLFDDATSAELQSDLERAWRVLDRWGIEIYSVALQVQQVLLWGNGGHRDPSKCSVVGFCNLN